MTDTGPATAADSATPAGAEDEHPGSGEPVGRRRAVFHPLEVSEVLPLEEIARAHELLENGHTRGKLVLDVLA